MGVAEAQKFVHILRSTFNALEVLNKYLLWPDRVEASADSHVLERFVLLWVFVCPLLDL
jgi:hypothetical protein